MTDFEGFPKIARLNREIVITEKLDGTNAQIVINESGEIKVGSRNRWITPKDDNYGFAGWVERNKEEILKLGEGQHFGEWWGNGIQSGYGLKEKRFSLFNTHRWSDDVVRPACCHVVPILYQGIFSQEIINQCIGTLNSEGSVAAPGWMKPEGIIVYHTAANNMFKITCENDEKPKGQVQ